MWATGNGARGHIKETWGSPFRISEDVPLSKMHNMILLFNTAEALTGPKVILNTSNKYSVEKFSVH